VWCKVHYHYESFINQLQKFTDWYLGQASIMSHDILIEKISANTELKLSFTSPSIKELASSWKGMVTSLVGNRKSPKRQKVFCRFADGVGAGLVAMGIS
jgi:hypothetical protein